MSEDWGIPDWLPPTARRAAVAAELADQREDRAAAADRERLAEERHNRAMAAYRDSAEARGEVVDVIALAAGEVRGRSVHDVLAEALAASARDDARDARRVHRDGHGEPERLHVDFGEPVIHQARSETGMRLFTRYRHWKDAQDAKRAAEAAAERSRDDRGLVDGVTVRSREETSPVVAVPLAQRAEWETERAFRGRMGGYR